MGVPAPLIDEVLDGLREQLRVAVIGPAPEDIGSARRASCRGAPARGRDAGAGAGARIGQHRGGQSQHGPALRTSTPLSSAVRRWSCRTGSVVG